jgi:hypothetical protein
MMVTTGGRRWVMVSGLIFPLGLFLTTGGIFCQDSIWADQTFTGIALRPATIILEMRL